jgi:hypothetical protein
LEQAAAALAPQGQLIVSLDTGGDAADRALRDRLARIGCEPELSYAFGLLSPTPLLGGLLGEARRDELVAACRRLLEVGAAPLRWSDVECAVASRVPVEAGARLAVTAMKPPRRPPGDDEPIRSEQPPCEPPPHSEPPEPADPAVRAWLAGDLARVAAATRLALLDPSSRPLVETFAGAVLGALAPRLTLRALLPTLYEELDVHRFVRTWYRHPAAGLDLIYDGMPLCEAGEYDQAIALLALKT